ncbi:MAG: hypothetical protein JNJ54_04685 [Myxococcaceae bacterium]|nr:hypothetical protein [Myxococcaceae bacterium]
MLVAEPKNEEERHQAEVARSLLLRGAAHLPSLRRAEGDVRKGLMPSGVSPRAAETAHWFMRAAGAVGLLFDRVQRGEVEEATGQVQAQALFTEALAIASIQAARDDAEAEEFVRACVKEIADPVARYCGVEHQLADKVLDRIFGEDAKAGALPDLYSYELTGSVERLSLYVWKAFRRLVVRSLNQVDERFVSTKTLQRWRRSAGLGNAGKFSDAQITQRRLEGERAREHRVDGRRSVNQVAKEFGVSPHTVAKWVKTLRSKRKIEAHVEQGRGMTVTRLTDGEVEALKAHGQTLGVLQAPSAAPTMGLRSHVDLAADLNQLPELVASWVETLTDSGVLDSARDSNGVYWLADEDVVVLIKLAADSGLLTEPDE